MAATTPKVDDPQPTTLDPRWRAALAAVALASFVIAIVLWFAPPQQSKFAPAATDKAGIAKVDAPSETLSTAFLGLAALLLVIAANGRRVASFKFGDNEAVFADRKAITAGTFVQLQAAKRGWDAGEAELAGIAAKTIAYATPPESFDLEHISNLALASVRKTG